MSDVPPRGAANWAKRIGWIVVTAVLTAAAGIWVSTFYHPGSPKIVIASVNEAGSFQTSSSATIDVENTGNKPATNCILYWDPGTVNLAGATQTRSAIFGLNPGAEREFTLTNPSEFLARGTVDIDAFVECDDSINSAEWTGTYKVP
jgi:hypothetical protein